MEKGPRNSNQIVTIFFISPRGGHIGFQNGRHFQHILAYISTSELSRELKMVAKPLFLIIWIVIKVLRKLLFIFLLAAILDFKMAAIFNIFWSNFSTSELLGSSKWMVAIPMLMMLRDVKKALGKLLVVIFLVAILNFQNGRHLNFKMASIFNIFWTISQLLSYLESSELCQYPCLWCLWLPSTHLESYQLFFQRPS